jgi:hypothetical protein
MQPFYIGAYIRGKSSALDIVDDLTAAGFNPSIRPDGLGFRVRLPETNRAEACSLAALRRAINSHIPPFKISGDRRDVPITIGR